MLDFVVHKRGKGLYGTSPEHDLTEDEKVLDALLDGYGFQMADEFDLILLEGIRSGYFDERRLLDSAARLNEKVKAMSSEKSLEAGWRLYHDSFDDNETEVVDALIVTFQEHVKFVTPVNLDGTVRLLKDLGGYDTNELIEYYMSERNESREFFDLSESPFGDSVLDEDVRKAFAKKLATFKDHRWVTDVLIRIFKEHGWGRDDIALLGR
jgi:hypothetical protein